MSNYTHSEAEDLKQEFEAAIRAAGSAEHLEIWHAEEIAPFCCEQRATNDVLGHAHRVAMEVIAARAGEFLPLFEELVRTARPAGTQYEIGRPTQKDLQKLGYWAELRGGAECAVQALRGF